jgi:hypothetical protein
MRRCPRSHAVAAAAPTARAGRMSLGSLNFGYGMVLIMRKDVRTRRRAVRGGPSRKMLAATIAPAPGMGIPENSSRLLGETLNLASLRIPQAR